MTLYTPPSAPPMVLRSMGIQRAQKANEARRRGDDAEARALHRAAAEAFRAASRHKDTDAAFRKDMVAAAQWHEAKAAT